ncbi:hypothetical protein BDR03DRAFT_984675 [Suillus americanus]|nr:hypothetical protein BDR03DRAFT_984675 [Suillus americanus]
MDKSSSESSESSSGSSSSLSSSALSNSTDSKEEEYHGSHRELPFSPPKGNYGVTYFNPRHKAAALRQLNATGSHLVPKGNHLAPEVPDHLSEGLGHVSEVLDDTEEIDELAEIDTPNTPINNATVIESSVDNIIAHPPFTDNMIDPHLRGDSGMANPPAPPAGIPEQDLHEPVNNHDINETPSAEQDTEGAVDDRDTPLNPILDEHKVNSNRTASSPDSNLSLNLPALPLSPLWFKNPFQQLMNPTPASPWLIQLFGKLWSWWLTLQPEWRKCQAPTLMACAVLPRTDDSNLDTLNTPGANGMLSVVATLKWWADSADGKGCEDSHWEDAADNVMWVLDRLIATSSMSKSMASSGNQKWGRSDTQANVSSLKRTHNQQ